VADWNVAVKLKNASLLFLVESDSEEAVQDAIKLLSGSLKIRKAECATQDDESKVCLWVKSGCYRTNQKILIPHSLAENIPYEMQDLAFSRKRESHSPLFAACHTNINAS